MTDEVALHLIFEGFTAVGTIAVGVAACLAVPMGMRQWRAQKRHEAQHRAAEQSLTAALNLLFHLKISLSPFGLKGDRDGRQEGEDYGAYLRDVHHGRLDNLESRFRAVEDACVVAEVLVGAKAGEVMRKVRQLYIEVYNRFGGLPMWWQNREVDKGSWLKEYDALLTKDGEVHLRATALENESKIILEPKIALS